MKGIVLLNGSKELICIGIGSLLVAVSFNCFFVPSQIAPGGVTGIAVLINHAAGLPVGAMSLALNVPLFLLAFRQMGIWFVLKTAVSTVLLSFMIDLLSIPFTTQDIFLASMYGGVLLGAGLAIVMRFGATTGGTDMAARMIHHRFRSIAVGWILFFVDFLVIAASAFVFDPERALYAIVSIFVSSKIVDLASEGANSAKAFFIISNHAESIAHQIINELERGVTGLNGRGIYRNNPGEVLFCVALRTQVASLKRIIRDIDPYAFVIVTDAREVLGEGFTVEVQPKKKKKRRQEKLAARGRE